MTDSPGGTPFGDLEKRPAPVMLPFEEAPCRCVGRHVPTPLRTEQHHVFPQEFQKARYGKVVDRTTVPLCDVAHANVHIALTARLKGEDYRLGNRYQQKLVERGMHAIQSGQL